MNRTSPAHLTAHVPPRFGRHRPVTAGDNQPGKPATPAKPVPDTRRPIPAPAKPDTRRPVPVPSR